MKPCLARVRRRGASQRLTVGFRLALMATLLGLAALPAAAQAQLSDSPDSYLFATQVNSPDEPLLGPGADRPQYADVVDTTGFGQQADLFVPPGSGGGPERTSCEPASNLRVTTETSAYGRTTWWDIHPDVSGIVLIQATGFDAVIGMVRYQSIDNSEVVEDLGCSDDPASASLEQVAIEVRAGLHYSIQVGGFGGYVSQGGDPSLADSGTLEFRLDFFPDSDLDGVLDGGPSPDRCPAQPGPAPLRGCPDGDNDGTPNIDDQCPQPGPTHLGGCPDTDGDGLRDLDRDNCDTVAGPQNLDGCPDADGDGIPEGQGASPRDRCENHDPEEFGRLDRSPRDGCSDHITIRTTVSREVTTRNAPRGGLVFRFFRLTNVPEGARVSVVCKPRRRCRSFRIARTTREGTFTVRSLRGKAVRSGTRIIARVTASNATGKYIRLTVVRGSLRCSEGPTSRRLKKCR
jgi:hypothetical protein